MGEEVSRKSKRAASKRAAAGRREMSRRQVVGYGVLGVAAVGTVGAIVRYGREGAPLKAVVEDLKGAAKGVLEEGAVEVFKGGAPDEQIWQIWKERGWVKEAKHYLKLGRNVQCRVCPNECLLEPGDRSRCRNKVHKEGKLHTMAYGNPCALHIDPIEKKPLFHFLPATRAFSIATSGCSLRCLNCQNWEISQKTPEETKSAVGEAVRLGTRRAFGRSDRALLSAFPEDVVKVSAHTGCESIAYTYSEPTSFYEYMIDTAKLARARGIKNVWVTNGYIQREALEELCKYLDGANVDLKSFSEEIYDKLNSGKLQPILDTLMTLKEKGVWFEVTNLVVPRHTDDLGMIRRMCDWLVKNVGPDYPLHISRFHPQHKLDHLPPTPIRTLTEAREVARDAGLNYVYLGNVRGVQDAETTFCPGCRRRIIRRDIYHVRTVQVSGGKCAHCSKPIAGVWS